MTRDPSSPPDPVAEPAPVWVAAPGILKIPFLQTFLPEYTLYGVPWGDEKAVLGWGLKPTAAIGRRWAERRHRPYVALEDGFLRSVGLGESGATSLSLIVDDIGIYYDASRPSRLEQWIQTAPDWCDAAMRSRARRLVNQIVRLRLSKTNMGQPLDPSILRPGRRILIVDQTHGDASIAGGLATQATFDQMVDTVRRLEPDAQLIVKRHPAVAAGRKQGCISFKNLSGMTLIDTDVAASDLLDHVDAVHVVTSGLGFEALFRGLPVHCHGVPFYAGWGLTHDTVTTPRRKQPRDLEAVVAAALIAYSRYVDPVTGQRCEVEQAADRLALMLQRSRRLAGHWSATGFAPAKRPAIRRLINGPATTLRYHWRPGGAAQQAIAESGRMLWWAGKETPAILTAAEAFDGPRVRMEDGFIRSRGLGSDFHGALSVALDDQGVYYDAGAPSRLETLIQTTDLDEHQRQRAINLCQRITDTGLSKYNLPGQAPTGWPQDRPKIVIVGQVENDRSIRLGCDTIFTNSGLVEATRRDFPDAFLIYRNHPDVMAGNRPGLLETSALGAVDAIADDLAITDCLAGCDRLATLTSLAGFEALMRGKAVTTYGRPFYAGWGLTDDRATPIARRTRRATLDELIHAALIAYPIYATPEGWPCEVEDLVEALIASRDTPVTPGPRSRVARWYRGLKASLDRTPPPAY